MIKPIVRWTIGNVSNQGFKCLKHSIDNFIRLYGDKFDYYVCYNNIKKEKLNFLNELPINFLNQHEYVDEIKLKPSEHPCWKLFPPRIKNNIHEIFIDNDLVLYKKLPIINKFLKSKDLLIITEANNRAYGSFDKFIFLKSKLNTGLFGLYPNFNFKNKINKFINKFELEKWEDHCDEQGLVACIFQKENFALIPKKKLLAGRAKLPLKRKLCGIHYIGINRNENCKSLIYNMMFKKL